MTEVRLILLMTAVLFALVVAFWVEVAELCIVVVEAWVALVAFWVGVFEVVAFTSGICEMADIEIDGLTSDSLLQILRLLII